VAILYCAIQWKYAASIGPNKIFSSSRTIDRADFADMLNGLSIATQRACSANPLSRLLFDDGDSASPYMKISGDRLSGCVTVRETNVTQFSKAEIENCNAVFIRELTPSDKVGLQPSDGRSTRPWVEMDRWMSSDGQFGFALYRHPCIANEDGDVIQK
jgi:hypothetical protein